MKYVMLVYQDERSAKAATDEQMAASEARFNRFHEEIGASGHLLDGQRLRHSDTATSVKVRQGEVLTTDGPYAETKEQLGGFYLMECEDLDEAIRLASRIPTAESGTVEIRPVYTRPTEDS